ncbi:hypothetical protein FisN_5Hh389 [Fistulifera solaris]|uniref:Nucleotide exchange factor SIL1 n=1 Tax=Fistulifera solaris TaxID=1519565 RepID=A0A1Z5JSL2_FISSO|nr:hypothetical protein FisN_5Hh389 [Fistulifera solaris]|eukprot:GAX17007.1 hypothetical protein FisN_5Hh389 [Fistulifera solaris]
MMRKQARISCLGICVLLWSFLISSYIPSWAKEIEATEEWTLLGENDTVDAGMHIRIDMTTGEKWVKLISDDDSKSSTQDVQVSTDGGMQLVPRKDSPDPTTIPYDFDMMHRTLSKLPEDEQEQLGLPSLPEGTVQALSANERHEFERTMTKIWEKRQAQLKAVMEESVADLPEILKDRIARIQEYIMNPVAHLETADFENTVEGQVSHILSVVQDLEFSLSDVDMARDFFTMGGWNLLLSLISEDVHTSPNATSTHHLRDKINMLQGHAAWALGTSVKNVGEFYPFATAKVHLFGNGERVVSAIQLLLEEYDRATTSELQSDESTQSRYFKCQKLLYAMGSLLRANRAAQTQFVGFGGPMKLGAQLAKSFEQDESMRPGKTKESLLVLANDLVSDVTLHPGKSEQVDDAIIQSFSTSIWCDSILLALESDFRLQEKAFEATRTFLPHCRWQANDITNALSKLRSSWEGTGNERDADLQYELLKLVDSTLAML